MLRNCWSDARVLQLKLRDPEASRKQPNSRGLRPHVATDSQAVLPSRHSALALRMHWIFGCQVHSLQTGTVVKGRQKFQYNIDPWHGMSCD